MFEVGWAAHIRGGCPGRGFGRFGVRGGFCSFFASVCVRVRVCWPSTDRYSRRWEVCQGRFHGVHGPRWRPPTWVTW